MLGAGGERDVLTVLDVRRDRHARDGGSKIPATAPWTLTIPGAEYRRAGTGCERTASDWVTPSV